MMNSSPAVSIAGLWVKPGKVQVFDGLDLDLAPGRRPRTVSARVVSLALVVALTAGCAASSARAIAVTGTVDDDLLTVATPFIGAVAPNSNAGFSAVPPTPKATPAPAPLRVTWAVGEGTRVEPGDDLVR